jgi:methionine-rich copper-binding protein CopC
MLRCLLLLFVGLGATPALAHAFLDHALPAVGSTVHESPHEIRLWFTQRLEPAFSRARVFDPSGKEVDAGDSRVDSADPSVIVTTVATLPPGAYRVVWRVVSIDTHVTEGDFTFEVS